MHDLPNGNGKQTDGLPSFGMAASGAPRPLGAAPDLARIQRSLGESEEKRRFSANDYLRLLWKGKWIIGACVAVAGLLTAYYTYSLPFIYQASLDISVNEREMGTLFATSNAFSSYYNRDRALKNELQFMTSLEVYQKTATELLHQRVIDPTSPQYADSTIPLVAAAERVLAPRLHGASPDERERKLVEHIAASVQAMTVVSPSKDADVISITTRSGDPREASLITNTYAEIYTEHSRKRNQEKYQRIADFVEGRLDTTKRLLAATENQLEEFKESAGIAGEALAGDDLAQQKANLEEALSAVRIDINTVTGHLRSTQEQLAKIEPNYAPELAMALPELITNQTALLAKEETALNKLLAINPRAGSEVAKQRMISERKKRVTDMRRELESNVRKYKESNIGSLPGANDIAATGPTGPLNALKGKIFEDEIELKRLHARQSAILTAINDLEAQMARIPGLATQLGRYIRDKEGLEEINKTLEDQYIKGNIDKEAIISTVRIISPSQADTNPISPNRRANLVLGTIVGLGLGIGVVLLIAYADTTIHSPDELTDKGFTVLAAIPAIEPYMKSTARKNEVRAAGPSGTLSPHLISFSDPDSPITESYRSLRTAIQFASIVEPIRMLLVTSSVPQEGKSTTSANLAIVMANSGLRTLLIDCDLRRPIAHANFGMPKEPGLVNALIGETMIGDAIRHSGIPNLDILSSGSIPPNPSELLGSKRMSDLLASLREMYDLVLIDSPPVGVVTDGVILSTKVDATVVVVRAHKTRMEFLDRTSEDVSRVSGPLLGVVLNEFDASQSYGSSYKYYRYYKYYGYYGQKDGARDRKARRATTAKKNAEATN